MDSHSCSEGTNCIWYQKLQVVQKEWESAVELCDRQTKLIDLLREQKATQKEESDKKYAAVSKRLESVYRNMQQQKIQIDKTECTKNPQLMFLRSERQKLKEECVSLELETEKVEQIALDSETAIAETDVAGKS